MIISRQVYEKLVEIINNGQLRNSSRMEIFKSLQQSEQNTQSKHKEEEKEGDKSNLDDLSSISYQTFTSIYSNLKRRSLSKKHNWRKENNAHFALKYNQLNEEENDSNDNDNSIKNNNIIKLANEMNISPTLMTRFILDGMVKLGLLDLNSYSSNNKPVTIGTLMRETHLITSPEHGRLANDIMHCCIVDEDYGPCIDVIKNIIGLEYEMKLENILIDNKLCYVKEDELREKGFDKTPDFKLDVPICVNGRMISWIDSKASFGDIQTNRDSYESQFKFYLNRYGSGLVIYWFGYVNDIEKQYSNIDNRFVMISDCFPKKFSTLNVDSLLAD
jgi:hypothetical protein